VGGPGYAPAGGGAGGAGQLAYGGGSGGGAGGSGGGSSSGDAEIADLKSRLGALERVVGLAR
jgi:hypothetical protein